MYIYEHYGVTQDDLSADEPVAIIGMACRLPPSLGSPTAFWEFLLEGRRTVRDMPEERLEPYLSSSPRIAAVLRRAASRGSYLDDIKGFDAGFFGISPREAEQIDPQQRLLLEVAWEALERSGIPPTRLRGTEAGVFVAANAFDYATRAFGDVSALEPWSVNGSMLFAMANRISYTMDLRGPSMVVDTACAGSLTALHLACQSLWRNETPLVMVAGAHVMAGPTLTVALGAAQATAPDGMSKTFDKDANGYGRGEGAAVLVLKRLSDAARDGNNVLGVIRATGVFQDGRSDGMMAPNAAAQEHMLRRVYSRAGIELSTVDYVEAHGTGTPVGDRAEIEALGWVFGAGRPPSRPLLVGSVKPNVGHLEAGAGLVGVIKVIQALGQGLIPRTLYDELNPDIDWDGLSIRPVSETTAWPAGDRPRRAGVSSFGFGGTIAHVVLEQAPPPPARMRDVTSSDKARRESRVYPVSAMSEAGLRDVARNLTQWLTHNPEVSMASVGFTLAAGRSHLVERGAVIARDREELLAGLSSLASDDGADFSRARAVTEAEPVWVFSGHGAQWPEMGRGLLEHNAAFTAAVEGLDAVYARNSG